MKLTAAGSGLTEIADRSTVWSENISQKRLAGISNPSLIEPTSAKLDRFPLLLTSEVFKYCDETNVIKINVGTIDGPQMLSCCTNTLTFVRVTSLGIDENMTISLHSLFFLAALSIG